MMPDTEHDTIAVTLQLPPETYAIFLKQARKAGVGLETYLNEKLAATLGSEAAERTSRYTPPRNGKGQ